MFRLQSIKQHSESIAILIFFFHHSSALPWASSKLACFSCVSHSTWLSFVKKAAKSCLRSESHHLSSLLLCFTSACGACHPALHTEQAASLAFAKRPECFLAPYLQSPWDKKYSSPMQPHISLPSCIHAVGPLWPNWDFAHVLRKLNYCIAKGHLCPESLAQMMRLFYSPF